MSGKGYSTSSLSGGYAMQNKGIFVRKFLGGC